MKQVRSARFGAVALAVGLALLFGGAAERARAKEPIPEPAQEPAGEAAGSAVPEGDGTGSPQEVAAFPGGPGISATGTFFESVDVSIVNLDVYVRDREGSPVRGLGVGDFVVLEDGEEIEISHFAEVDGRGPASGRSIASEAPEEIRALPPTAARLPAPTPEPVYLIVYIDNFNIRPFDRNRVFRRLRRFMADEVESGTQTMIVTYDRSLNVRQPFTTDARLLESRLVELETFTGHRVQLESERRQLLGELIDAQSLSDADWRIRQYADSLLNDVSFSIDAIKEMVGSLAGLEGRKMLLYVSDGVPMIAGQDLYYFVQEKFGDSSSLGEMMNYDASRQFRQLATLANSNDVTFYTIDAAGLRVSSSIGAENARTDRTVNPGFMDSIETNNLQAPLVLLANETGGQVIMNTNDIGDGLERIAEDFGTYYSLAYTPRQVENGRYRRVEVKLREKQRGVRIRHRAGYRSKSAATRMSDGTLATLQYGFDSNPLGATLAFGAIEPLESQYFGVPVQVTIPLGRIVLVPRETLHQGRLRLYIGAMDEDGDLSPIQQVPLVIEVPNEDVAGAREQGYLYQMKVQIRGGEHRVVVGVLDEFGGVESFIGGTLWVG